MAYTDIHSEDRLVQATFAEHLQNGIARDQMNQQKDDRNHEPQDRKSVEGTG